MPSFRVDDEPWMPVVYSDGTTKEVGLREVLLQAHEIRAVRDPLPLSELGVYRLLIAFVLDIFVIEPGDDRTIEPDLDGLTELLSAGAFDTDAVNAYFDRYAERFDLFSETHPFLQTPGLTDTDSKVLSVLLPAEPSGGDAILFHHTEDKRFATTPAMSARLLTTLAAFAVGAGRGWFPSVNGTPPWYVLIDGKTLFETLCLNLFLIHTDGKEYQMPPAWRSKRPVPGGGGRAIHAYYAEGLTWRCRCVRLLPEGEGTCSITGVHSLTTVRRMFFKAGDSCDGTIWDDPMVAYYTPDAATGKLPQRVKEDKEVWRDSGPLVLLSDVAINGRVFSRPLSITQFARLASEGRLAQKQSELRLTLYGMRVDKAKIFEWQKEALSLPAPLLWNSSFALDAHNEIQSIDDVRGALRMAIKKNYERDGAGNKSAFDTRIASASRALFAGVKHGYDTFLRGLAALDPDAETLIEQKEALRKTLREMVRTEARHALEEATDDLVSDSEALMRQVRASAFFENRLATILFPKPKLPDSDADGGKTRSKNTAAKTILTIAVKAIPADVPQTALSLD